MTSYTFADYSSTKRGQMRAETQRKMMQAAKAEFLEHGWQGATVRGIASRAGMSTGAFFNVFEGKDQAWREATGFQTPDDWSKSILETIR